MLPPSVIIMPLVVFNMPLPGIFNIPTSSVFNMPPLSIFNLPSPHLFNMPSHIVFKKWEDKCFLVIKPSLTEYDTKPNSIATRVTRGTTSLAPWSLIINDYLRYSFRIGEVFLGLEHNCNNVKRFRKGINKHLLYTLVN